MLEIHTLLELSKRMRLFDPKDKDIFIGKLCSCPRAHFEKHKHLLEVAYNLHRFITSKGRVGYIESPRVKNIHDLIPFMKLLYSYTSLDRETKKAFRESIYISPNWSINNICNDKINQRD